MKHHLYHMTGTDPAGSGGDKKSWFYYYKWGRPEEVAVFLHPEENHLKDVEVGDRLFFVMDRVVIGCARITAVREGFVSDKVGEMQELCFQSDQVKEFTPGVRLRWWHWLPATKKEVPKELAEKWLQRPSRWADLPPANY